MLYPCIVILISVLALVRNEYQEMKLIDGLNNAFHFDHNIFVVDTATDMLPFINGTELMPRSMFVLQENANNSNVFEKWKITSKSTFIIVVPGNCKFIQSLDFLKLIKDSHRRRITKKIGIFFPECATIDDVRLLLEWCKKKWIVHIFVAIETASHFSIFTFNPFGPVNDINLVNLTSSGYASFFANTKSDYRQLTVEPRLTNYGHEILWPTDFFVTEFYMKNRRDYSESDVYEDGILALPMISYGCEDDKNVYPLIRMPQVIVVPQSLPYAGFTAYLQTLTSDQLFGYSLTTIAVVMLLLCTVRYIKQKKILFFQSVADILNLLINDNGYIKYQRLSRSEGFLIVPFTFVGLVFVNGILSTLQSYITQPIYQPQINSLDDIFSSSLTIHTLFSEWKDATIDELTARTQKDWSDKVVVLDKYELAKKISMFDRVAFVASLSTANSLVQTQKRLNIRGYHITQIQVGNLCFVHPIADTFLFFERLNEINQCIQNGGLYDLWTRQNFANVEKNVVKKNLERLNAQRNEESDVGELDFPIFIAYGWLAGIIVLFIEIIWKKISDFYILRGILT